MLAEGSGHREKVFVAKYVKQVTCLKAGTHRRKLTDDAAASSKKSAMV